MARLPLDIEELAHGSAPTYTPVLGADDAKFAFDPDAFLHVKNTTGSPIVLTVPTNETVDGDLVVPNRTITVPANDAVFTKPFDKDIYRQSDGSIYLNAPADGLSIAVLKLP